MNSKLAAKQDFIPLMRELVRTYQAFARYDASGYHNSGLTTAQADVLFTLGNTDGLTFKEIGQKTLITKGTLTGVVDRLQKKTWVVRVSCPDDARRTRVKLTRSGRRVFEREFPRQIEFLKMRFDKLPESERRAILKSLQSLHRIF